jgi:AbrB family looped-hinge helix DNA binding protein
MRLKPNRATEESPDFSQGEYQDHIQRLSENLDKLKADATILVKEVENPKIYGVIDGENVENNIYSSRQSTDKTIIEIVRASVFLRLLQKCGNIYIRGHIHFYVGTRMSDTTIKIDGKGRIIIPKNIREAAKLKEGSYVTIKAKEKAIIVEQLQPVADKYYGAFKITKWPENIDEFIVEAMKKWWTTQAT